jgi:hypothetical protein
MKHYTTSCYLANAIIDNVKIEAFIDFVKCKGWIEYEQERQDIKIFRYKKFKLFRKNRMKKQS